MVNLMTMLVTLSAGELTFALTRLQEATKTYGSPPFGVSMMRTTTRRARARTLMKMKPLAERMETLMTTVMIMKRHFQLQLWSLKDTYIYRYESREQDNQDNDNLTT